MYGRSGQHAKHYNTSDRYRHKKVAIMLDSRRHPIHFFNHFVKDGWQRSVLKLSVAWPVHAKIIQSNPPLPPVVDSVRLKVFKTRGLKMKVTNFESSLFKAWSRRQEATTYQPEWPAACQHTGCKRRFFEVRLPPSLPLVWCFVL